MYVCVCTCGGMKFVCVCGICNDCMYNVGSICVWCACVYMNVHVCVCECVCSMTMCGSRYVHMYIMYVSRALYIHVMCLFLCSVCVCSSTTYCRIFASHFAFFNFDCWCWPENLLRKRHTVCIITIRYTATQHSSCAFDYVVSVGCYYFCFS